MDINTNKDNASNRTPYTCIMPLPAKKLKKLPPELLLLDDLGSFFFVDFFPDFWAALELRDMVVVLDGVREGFETTWLMTFIAEN